MSKRIAIIAEDESDVEVITTLVRKLRPTRNVSFKRALGHGCGRIKSKCREWANNLSLRGCQLLILVQDLDNADGGELARELAAALRPCPIMPHVVVIPIREIEAWLLSDPRAIRAALNLRSTPSHIANPEAIFDPKRKLREIIESRSQGRKIYINTIHNARIAQHLALSRLRNCRSFLPLEAFCVNHV
jgi:Domain of unknown function (DUF4276)